MLGTVVRCVIELQHHLVADHVFPAKAEDHVYFEMATQRMAHRLRLRARRKQAKDPDASAPEVAAATTQPQTPAPVQMAESARRSPPSG